MSQMRHESLTNYYVFPTYIRGYVCAKKEFSGEIVHERQLYCIFARRLCNANHIYSSLLNSLYGVKCGHVSFAFFLFSKTIF